MSLESLIGFGSGGAGLDAKLKATLTELQGLSFAVVAGATANTKMDIAAIRPEDTLKMVLQIADAGTATDQLSATTIVDCRATGTITVGTVVTTNAATVNAVVYTWKTSPVSGVTTDLAILGSPTLNAAQLAARINTYESARPAGAQVRATSDAAIVTITAVADGTGGNSKTLVGTTNVTASGATLSGGTATGGIKCTNSTASSKVVVVYFNKR
jgi:hypothetical protein